MSRPPSLPTPHGATRRRLALLAVALAATLVAAGPLHAQGDAAFDAAMARFTQAAAGQADAIEDSVARLNELLAREPADPLLRAYLGAATSLRATTTWLPWKKMSHAEDGLAQIDKALAMLTPAHDAAQRRGVPVSLETRFVAANTFLGLPGMFNRGDRGRKLLAEVIAHPQLAATPAPFRATVWMRAARLAEADQQREQARQWYEKVVASGTPQAAAASARLREL